jgi:acyl CoA:acetate/3-ketoacid CoA transferase
MGDGEGSGIEHLGYRKLVRRVVGGHWAWSDRMQALAAGNEIEAYGCGSFGVIRRRWGGCCSGSGWCGCGGVLG